MMTIWNGFSWLAKASATAASTLPSYPAKFMPKFHSKISGLSAVVPRYDGTEEERPRKRGNVLGIVR
jgi:hypothetical protein